MKNILLIIIIVLAATIPAVAATPVDVFIDFEQGNIASVPTATNFNAATHPTGTGSWTIKHSITNCDQGGDGFLFSTVTGATTTLAGPVSAGGTEYSTIGDTRGLRTDLTNTHEYAKFTLPSSQSVVNASAHIYSDYAQTWYSVPNLGLWSNGTAWCQANLTHTTGGTYYYRSESSTSGTAIYGANIAVSNATGYTPSVHVDITQFSAGNSLCTGPGTGPNGNTGWSCCTGLETGTCNTTVGECIINIYDSAGNEVGSSRGPFQKNAAITDVKIGKMGNGCTPLSSGYFTTDNLIIDWSHGYDVLSPALLESNATYSLPADRQALWSSAGRAAAIPTGQTICSSLTPTAGSDDSPQISAAIVACPDGQVVSLGTGTFKLATDFGVQKSNVVLRGQGPESTVLNITAAPAGNGTAIFTVGNSPAFASSAIPVTDLYSKGSYTLTLSDNSSISTGDLLILTQTEGGDVTTIGVDGQCGAQCGLYFCDNDVNKICTGYSDVTTCGAGTCNVRTPVGQMVKVTSKNINGIIGIELPVSYPTYTAAQSPRVLRITNMLSNIGLEDFTVTQATGTSQRSISVLSCDSCWFRNIEIANVWHYGLPLAYTYRSNVSKLYVHDRINSGSDSDQGYGLPLRKYSTSNLIEDNAFINLQLPIDIEGGASGNVIAYNYAHGLNNSTTALNGSIQFHSAYPTHNLCEGNVGRQAAPDNTWGGGAYNTFFRDYFSGYEDEVHYQKPSPVRIYKGQYYHSFIGNVLGINTLPTAHVPAYSRYSTDDTVNDPNCFQTASIYLIGYDAFSDCNQAGADSKVRTTLIRHGEYDYYNNAQTWNGSDSHTLPDSLYLSGKPSWYGTATWPPIDPVTSSVAKLPAQLRYESSITYTVTPSAGANGSISPNTPQSVVSGATTTFTVTLNSGYMATVSGTCGGSLSGTTYTTSAITGNCTVSASFNLVYPVDAYTINADFGSGTIGQRAQGTSGLTIANIATTYSGTGFSGQGAAMQWTSGQTGQGTTGGSITLTRPVTHNKPLWFRSYPFFPTGWAWPSAGNYVYVMRVPVYAVNGSLLGNISLLGNSAGNILMENTVSSPTVTTDTGVAWSTNTWQAIEMGLRFSTTGPAVKVWKNNVLILADTTNRTMQNTSDYVAYVEAFPYWTNGAAATQVSYVDEIVVTTKMPQKVDANQFHMVGSINWSTLDTTSPTVPTGVTTPSSPMSRRYKLNIGGTMRTYQVRLPAGFDPNLSYPLVIYFHGGGGNIIMSALDNVESAADTYGFIVATPSGSMLTVAGYESLDWNIGSWATGACCGSADDVGFTKKMIAEIQRNFRIDKNRIYATGISNGGGMANRVACELSDKIAAIATVAPAAIESTCSPSHKVAVMDIHGTGDLCNLYSGGTPTNFCGLTDYTRMTPAQVLTTWLGINGGNSNSHSTVYQNGAATCESYPGTVETEMCVVTGMGHVYPNGYQYYDPTIIGPVSHDLTFAQIWSFFSRNHR